MAINPTDFGVVARSLGDKSSCTEAELRTAVGRLYYSLYHVTFRRLISIGELDGIPAYDAHSKVIHAVRAMKVNLGDKLDRLRIMRRQADYVLDSSDQNYISTYADWHRNYSVAKDIAAQIGPHLGSLPRRQP